MHATLIIYFFILLYIHILVLLLLQQQLNGESYLVYLSQPTLCYDLIISIIALTLSIELVKVLKVVNTYA